MDQSQNEKIEYSKGQVVVGLMLEPRTGSSPPEELEVLLEWLDDLCSRRFHASRFIAGIDGTPARVAVLEPDNGANQDLSLELTIFIAGDSEDLIIDRFENWRTFVQAALPTTAAADRRLPLFELGPLIRVESIAEDRIDPFLGSVFFPGFESWANTNDRGGISDSDRAEVHMEELREKLLFETDQYDEAIESLLEFTRHVQDVYAQPSKWRWAIRALHSAVQAFMVLALQGTWDVKTLRPRQAQKVLKTEHCVPDLVLEAEAQLDDFPNLYTKIKDPEMMREYSHSRAFEPENEVDDAIEWLNKTRNQLQHFRSMCWSIYTYDFPSKCQACLSVIAFLHFECNNITWFPRSNAGRAQRAIKEANQAVDNLRKRYQELEDQLMP